MLSIGDKVIAITSKPGIITAGNLYIIESVDHPSLGKCGLVKLKDVRDYWSDSNFVKITKDLIDQINQN
jgi:hypothetical protein